MRLRPPTERDIAALYTACCTRDLAIRWRYRGQVPTFDQFVADLHDDVLCHHVLDSAQQGRELAGLMYMAASRPSYLDRLVHVSALAEESIRGSIDAARGLILFCSALFAGWDLRKLVFEIPEFNLGQVASAIDRGPLVREGVLRQHLWVDGRYHDVHLMALWRDDFHRFVA